VTVLNYAELGTSCSTGVRAIVVTVHGTWAASASWTRGDSPLGQALIRFFAERETKLQILPYLWSGKNTVKARAEAGARLAALLLAIARDNHEASLHVIAHSHGGSVLAYALKHRPELAAKIAGFVALATPWLDVDVHGYAVSLRSMLAKMLLFALFGSCLVAMIPAAFALIEAAHAAEVGIGEMDIWGELMRNFVEELLVVLAWTTVAAAVVGVLFLAAQRRLSLRLSRSTEAFLQSLREAAQAVSTMHEVMPPSAFLKPIGDEAALALTWASASAALMNAISTLLFVFLQGIRDVWLRSPAWARWLGGSVVSATWGVGTMGMSALEWSGLAAFGSSLLSFFSSDHFSDKAMAVPIVLAVLAWAAAATALLGMALVLGAASFAALGAGLSSWRAALYFRIVVEAVPAGTHELVLVDMAAVAQGERVAAGSLSHSAVYASPTAISAVLEALASFERRTAGSR
jgi:hypothetical protein